MYSRFRNLDGLLTQSFQFNKISKTQVFNLWTGRKMRCSPYSLYLGMERAFLNSILENTKLGLVIWAPSAIQLYLPIRPLYKLKYCEGLLLGSNYANRHYVFIPNA